MKSTRSLKTSQKEAKFSESIESNFTNLIEDLENFNEDVVDD